jgi:putative membrane protein
MFYVFFGIGAICGLIGFLFAIKLLHDNFNTQTYLFFLGLILGGLPFIFKTATSGGDGEARKFKPVCLVPAVLGFVLIVGLFLAEASGALGAGLADLDSVTVGIVLRVAAVAAIAAIAMVLPGISGAFILLAFGVYDVFTGALRELNFAIILPAGVGALIGIVGGAKLVRLLLKKYKLMVYSAIIGMVIGSVVPILGKAGTGLNISTLVGALFMTVGIIAVFMLTEKEAE